jgi:hypothetical protein
MQILSTLGRNPTHQQDKVSNYCDQAGSTRYLVVLYGNRRCWGCLVQAQYQYPFSTR